MPRTSFIVLLIIASGCFGVPASAVAAEGKCTSIQARCAIAIGGTCDPATGHWCYGFYQGRNCGGTSAAFAACMRHGGSAVNAPGAAAASGGNKCTSVQAQCAIEIGGRCDPRTGRWCYGDGNIQRCGGTNRGGAFDACVARKLGQQK